MIVRIGVDLVSVHRIREAMKRGSFVGRVLTPGEQDRDLTPEYVAGRFAAKEAVKKCLPQIGSWHGVAVLTGPSGEPVVRLSAGVLAEGQTLHVAISHERENAVAVAVLESTGP